MSEIFIFLPSRINNECRAHIKCVHADFKYAHGWGQKNHIRITYSHGATKCGRTLSRMNHTHLPHKLLITVYYNTHKHTHKIKNDVVK